jgi:hypothetical protein
VAAELFRRGDGGHGFHLLAHDTAIDVSQPDNYRPNVQ